jgi:hypothetical protein
MRLRHFFRFLSTSERALRVSGLMLLVTVCAGAYWLGVDHRRSGITPDGHFIEPK